MVKLIGPNKSSLQRIPTGFYSLDNAFIGTGGEIGLPMNTTIQIAGPTHCGKSTICYSLSGIIANQIASKITIADFEGFDPPFLESVFSSVGYEDEIMILQEKSDEATLTKLTGILSEDEYRIGIVDSIGAISPIAEKQGDIGDANMGRRAFISGQLIRRSVGVLNNQPKPGILFLINHVHQNIGYLGSHNVGGKALEYLCGIHISLKKKEEFVDKNDNIVAYHTRGQVTKNKYGRLGKQFNLVILSGFGIHKGLTAFMDCTEMGFVTAKNGVVRDTKGDKLCRTSEVMSAATNKDEQFFEVFYNLLKGI